MKTQIITSLLALTLLGCANTPESQMKQLAADARDIAEVGTTIALIEKPDNRDEIERVVAGLKQLEALPDPITMENLHTVLLLLPVDDLASERGQLYIMGARIILRRVGYEVELGSVSTVRPIVTALREGMEAGLK